MITIADFRADLGTEALSDLYGEWLEENGFDGDEPADSLLIHGKITAAQREFLDAFCAIYAAAEDAEESA